MISKNQVIAFEVINAFKSNQHKSEVLLKSGSPIWIKIDSSRVIPKNSHSALEIHYK